MHWLYGADLKLGWIVKTIERSQAQRRLDITHSHIWNCPVAAVSSCTPGKSRLFPCGVEDDSSWIVAWHAVKSMEKALTFIRSQYVPSTITKKAEVKSPEFVKMYNDAAEVVKDHLKRSPEDHHSLRMPALDSDSDHDSDDEVLPMSPGRMRMRVPSPADDGDDDESSDDDYVVGFARPRSPLPVHRPEPRVPRVPPPEQAWGQFENMVQFVMDSCAVNRRAATDALFANDRNPALAIEFLLQ
jgi:hypothetical protein